MTRRYFTKAFLKDTCVELLFQAHKVIAVSVLFVLCIVPVVTAGPALLALCACLRAVATDETLSVRAFFAELKHNFLRGLPLSALMALAAASVYSSLRLIAQGECAEYIIGTVGMVAVLGAAFFLFFLPFTLLKERSFPRAARMALAYLLAHMSDAVLLVSLCVILYFLARWAGIVGFFLYVPICAYLTARMNHAISIDIDERENQK